MSAHDPENIRCPQCSAAMDAGDRFCRRCGARRDAAALDASRQPDGAQTPLPSGRQRRAHRDVAESRVAVLVLLFAGLGPLAFPVLWRSSKFSRAWKVALTIIVSLVTCLVVWLLWYAIETFVEAVREYG